MTETQAFVEISSRSAAELAEKYVALWNEPDADRRRRTIAELWTEEGRHILQPAQEIRGIAARPGIGLTAILEARGYAEIEARAASAYEHWLGSEGLSFRRARRRRTTRRRRQVPLGSGRRGGEVFGVGLNFLVLAADGRIERDYTFVVALGGMGASTSFGRSCCLYVRDGRGLDTRRLRKGAHPWSSSQDTSRST